MSDSAPASTPRQSVPALVRQLRTWAQKYVTVHGAEGPQDSLWRTIQAITLGSIFLLLGVGWLMFSLSWDLANRREASARLVGMMADLNRYEKLLLDMETGQRGYLLTENPKYLEPFKIAVTEMPDAAADIELVLADYPAAKAQFAVVQAAEKAKAEELQHSRDVYLVSGREAAIELVKSDQGKLLMDNVRQSVDVLQSQVQTLLVERRADIESLSIKRNASMAMLLMLALTGSVLSLWLMRRYASAEYVAREQRARAEVADNANREKSRFLANMSHEIRTPMNAIFGFSQLLAEMVQDPREQFYANAITQSGKVLLGLINDILDMSKIEAGRLELSPEATDLTALVRSCELLFLQMAADKGLKLNVELPKQVPDALVLDPLRLRQVLINLVGNAIKYTPEGTVTLSAALSPSKGRANHLDLTLVVEDTGNGIAEDQLSHIFEPFTQLHKSDGTDGAGLGLSIVKRLVTLMGGTISVASELRRGSRFTVNLPAVPLANGKANAAVEVLAELGELPRLRILVVDDIELNRKLIESMFASTHHQLMLAESGEQALSLAAAEPPDLVFMDIRMPGMDGLTALKAFRESPQLKSCKVVAATASSLLGDEGVHRHLFDGYLRKPLTREAVSATLFKLFAPQVSSPQQVIAAAEVVNEVLSLKPEEARKLKAAHATLKTALADAQATFSTDAIRKLTEALEALGSSDGFTPFHSARERISKAASVFEIDALETQLPALAALLDQLNLDGADSPPEEIPSP